MTPNADGFVAEPVAAAPESKPFEQWATEKKTPAYLVAGTKNAQRWAAGREVTEEQYDAAVDAAANAKMSPG